MISVVAPGPKISYGILLQSTTLSHQVGYRELAGDPEVVHLEIGQVVYYRVIPLHSTFVHLHGHQGCSKSLGGGTDLEDGTGSYRICIDKPRFSYFTSTSNKKIVLFIRCWNIFIEPLEAIF